MRAVRAFQPHQHAQGMGVVVEAAVTRQCGIERILAGMAEGRMADVVGQAQRLGQVFVEASERAMTRPTCATSRLWVRRVR